MSRPRTTGRLEAARIVLLNAAQLATETGEYVIRYRCRSESDALNMRQACYTYQKSFSVSVRNEVIRDGLDPSIELPRTLLNATWPSAGIKYKCIEGVHWLLFVFKRIGTDPSWKDHVQANLFAGPPEKEVPEVTDIDELQEMINETAKDRT